MAEQLTDAEIVHALDVARRLVAAGVPVFAAAPDSSRPGEFHLPKAWQQWRPIPAAVDQWLPGWALGAGSLTASRARLKQRALGRADPGRA